mgnify:CR=1 FL=1
MYWSISGIGLTTKSQLSKISINSPSWRVSRCNDNFKISLWGSIVGYFFRAIIIIILDIPWISIVWSKILVLLVSAFYHAEIQIPSLCDKTQSCIFLRPSFHEVQHHALKVDTHSNYSIILGIWDKVFNTAKPGSKQVKCFIEVEGEKKGTLIRPLVKPFLNI